MSLGVALGITGLRSAILVAIALPLCLSLKTFLQTNRRFRSLAWLLLVVPVIAPRMLTGFGYANFWLSLVPYPIWNELLYAALLLITIVPVGAVMCYFAPPAPISKDAMHCLTLADSQSLSDTRLSTALRGPASQFVAAAGLMFVLAFQEFELASLMGVSSWTVWLFDAQAGGLILTETLRYALLPVLCELMVVGVAGWIVWKNAGLVARPQEVHRPMSTFGYTAGWFYLVFSVVLFCCVPWSFIFQAARLGLPQLSNNFTIGNEIVAGCLFSFLATSLAFAIAGLFVIRTEKSHSTVLRSMVCLFGLPGLLGSLVLGLSVLFVFQLSPLQNLYGTPVPWVLGSVLFLVPRALLVMLLLMVVNSKEAGHLTQLLAKSGRTSQRAQARELQWHASWALHFVAFILLFFWAYADLTTAAILAPPGMVTAPVRLYNLMHYGQSAVLSALVVATFGIPALVFGIIALFRKPLQKVLVP